MSSTEKRLLKEYRAVKKELTEKRSPIHDTGIVDLHPLEDGLFRWSAVIRGPYQSPFEDALWKLEIDIPTNYPLDPPKIKFVVFGEEKIRQLQRKTSSGARKMCYKMPHPNVNFKTGEICLDILQQKWSPAWTLQSALVAIVVLLANPEPLSPLNIDMANLLKCDDTTAYKDLVHYYIAKYSAYESNDV
ncbi:uncharacterized protein OGAPODRAFT_15367 [Ogataea polymorpha]|uniref:uncharacterized protein n=1 Tax=Ogataea polymorpha TaxID=460523 RepID=UPI0007F38B40|nr:uncharacterized protein OGAPODRAFT_15367 [Ogataea polymorpha]KAG7934037.1 hypothetical protein KL934_002959 [Ogataea polymorpha]OBA18721.1 hypothetical protein OGAPODRAFT_15367 [Ogataea polymorpha]